MAEVRPETEWQRPQVKSVRSICFSSTNSALAVANTPVFKFGPRIRVALRVIGLGAREIPAEAGPVRGGTRRIILPIRLQGAL